MLYHGYKITCDEKGCKNSFSSFEEELLRNFRQLSRKEGWIRHFVDIDTPRGVAKKMRDACPEHAHLYKEEDEIS